jgi:phosphate starvation-inducible PhoH-like protein
LNKLVNLPRVRISEVVLEPIDNARLANLCGQFDEHLRQMEQRLGVEINNRGNVFRVLGTPDATTAAVNVLRKLYDVTIEGPVTPSVVHMHLQSASVEADLEGGAEEGIAVRTRRILVRPRGVNQSNYLRAIRSHDISFGVGPAGTGKTYLAVACAVEALESERVRRLVLVRPAVEAGERLGFLPGDMAQKIDPYLRPLYDALYEMLGFERVAKLIERSVIEVAPLAFMRGRTLNEAFIILDEGQNTTVEQMKMFLTRIGFGSTAVVTGDITQVDLPRDRTSGLRQALEVLKGTTGISFTFFRSKDVVRHPVVARVLDAYDSFDHASGPDVP